VVELNLTVTRACASIQYRNTEVVLKISQNLLLIYEFHTKCLSGFPLKFHFNFYISVVDFDIRDRFHMVSGFRLYVNFSMCPVHFVDFYT